VRVTSPTGQGGRCIYRHVCEKGVSECVAVVQIIAGGERREIAGVESRCISSWRGSRRFRGGKMAQCEGTESNMVRGWCIYRRVCEYGVYLSVFLSCRSLPVVEGGRFSVVK